MLVTDIRHDLIHTYVVRLDRDEALTTVNKIYGELEEKLLKIFKDCLLYTSPSPRDLSTSRMPSSA